MQSELTLSLCLAFSLSYAAAQPRIATVADLGDLIEPPRDARIFYGSDPLQFGDLRLPLGEGPYPVAILIHGGCWLSQYDVTHVGSLAGALTRSGIATWTLEYRRVGDSGGGWPGTFADVAAGADFLREVAQDYPLNLKKVIAIGHSAGGQLALWLAARSKLPAASPLRSKDPIRLQGVLGLAAAADLSMIHKSGACNDVIDRLLGGSPEEQPERYRWVSPMKLTPIGVPQILINGAHDANWGPTAQSYFEAASAAGDNVKLIVAPESGHFEVIMPGSTTWPLVREAAWKLLQQVEPRPSRPQRPSIDGQVVFLYYDNLESARTFYGTTLGLKQTYDAGWVAIYATAQDAFVGLVDGARGFHQPAATKPLMLSIVTKDIDSWYERLLTAGVEMVSPLKNSSQSPVRSFIVKDPGGYTVEFFQWQ